MKNIKQKLGLGGATFGNILAEGMFGGVTEEESFEIINHAFRSGIKIFDTAPYYGFAKSELWYGRALKKIKRNEYNLTSKCGRLIVNYNSQKQKVSSKEIENNKLEAIYDYSPSGIRRSVEESLERLQTSYLDTLLLHDPDQANKEYESIKYAFPEMIKLKEEGLVRSIGCGMNQWEMPARFMKEIDIDKVLLAGRYTLLENKNSKIFLKICKKYNVKIIIGGPFNSGILARDLNNQVSYNYEPANDEVIGKVKKIENIVNKFGVSLKEAALNFAAMNDQVFSVVPGMSSTSEVDDNISSLNKKIPDEMWLELKKEEYI
jgi:D-threo-aldose 1-dehydrogenase